MAMISVGSFVPIPCQTVYLSGKASTQIGGQPIRMLITEESKPFRVMNVSALQPSQLSGSPSPDTKSAPTASGSAIAAALSCTPPPS